MLFVFIIVDARHRLNLRLGFFLSSKRLLGYHCSKQGLTRCPFLSGRFQRRRFIISRHELELVTRLDPLNRLGNFFFLFWLIPRLQPTRFRKLLRRLQCLLVQSIGVWIARAPTGNAVRSVPQIAFDTVCTDQVALAVPRVEYSACAGQALLGWFLGQEEFG